MWWDLDLESVVRVVYVEDDGGVVVVLLVKNALSLSSLAGRWGIKGPIEGQ